MYFFYGQFDLQETAIMIDGGRGFESVEVSDMATKVQQHTNRIYGTCELLGTIQYIIIEFDHRKFSSPLPLSRSGSYDKLR